MANTWLGPSLALFHLILVLLPLPPLLTGARLSKAPLKAATLHSQPVCKLAPRPMYLWAPQSLRSVEWPRTHFLPCCGDPKAYSSLPKSCPSP